MDKLVAELHAKAETLPAGSPIIGWNYDDTQLAEQVHPTRADLDKASTTHPILVVHISGHMAVANSAALDKYGVNKSTNVEGDGERCERRAHRPVAGNEGPRLGASCQ